MKLIFKTFLFFSIGIFSQFFLDAKTSEFIFDDSTQQSNTFDIILDNTPSAKCIVKESIPEPTAADSTELAKSNSFYFQQVKIENLGTQVVRNCFPYVNKTPNITLKKLASRLAKEGGNPVLALFNLWKQSVLKDENKFSSYGHPLDILNFKGRCSSEDFNNYFIQLCNALGIRTQVVNFEEDWYDFCLNDESTFLDLDNQHFYFGLNNETLVSSEEVTDDPFLALRTNHDRQTKEIDFKKAWKQISRFQILEPEALMTFKTSCSPLKKRARGFDLYPGEMLVFSTPAIHTYLAQHERYIEHIINLEPREAELDWDFLSPFPIESVENNSSSILKLVDYKIQVLPGQRINIKDKDIFYIKVRFAKKPKGAVIVGGRCTQALFPCLSQGKNKISLGVKNNPSTVRFTYQLDENLKNKLSKTIQILNQNHVFDYCSPSFQLAYPSEETEKIWWQISSDKDFQLIAPNFDQIENVTSSVTLPLISETFLNPETTYYFRVKGYSHGHWSGWSATFSFVVNKPLSVQEVEFEQIENNCYELNWERMAEEETSDDPIEYLVFGSNSLDFIPSIYHDRQINAIIDDQVTEDEVVNNLITTTREPKIRVSGQLAYYRIIAKQRGQLSVPSSIIRVYDHDLIQPRNVLQIVTDRNHNYAAKRVLFPAYYPWSEISLPRLLPQIPQKNQLPNLQLLLRSVSNLDKSKYEYESPDVSEEIWEEVRPYLLPANHPAWPKLNRIFCRSRAIVNSETFKKAGFKRWRPGRWSRVSASSHPEFKEYFIKAYCDCEIGILYDWKKWIHRIEGAECIRSCIKKYKLQSHFKVPHKWIYPLPKYPAPPSGHHYVRKNFILVCENMRIEEHDKNEKLYKKKMNKELLEGLYTILQVCGLYDSVYCFNIPFCKDGKIAVIDTEYHHKWPVPLRKLSHYFSKTMRYYWERITYKGGSIPDGDNQPNPPRMDRRDIPKQPKIIL